MAANSTRRYEPVTSGVSAFIQAVFRPVFVYLRKNK